MTKNLKTIRQLSRIYGPCADEHQKGAMKYIGGAQGDNEGLYSKGTDKKSVDRPQCGPNGTGDEKSQQQIVHPKRDQGVDGNILSGNRNGGKGYVDAGRQQSHEESDGQNRHSRAAFNQIEYIFKGKKRGIDGGDNKTECQNDEKKVGFVSF